MCNRVANILAPSDAVGHTKPVIERWRYGFQLVNLLRRYRFDALERGLVEKARTELDVDVHHVVSRFDAPVGAGA